ncbi:MAG: carboxyltransferase domain-containing protein, partial [Acidimicrobiales bacterium]
GVHLDMRLGWLRPGRVAPFGDAAVAFDTSSPRSAAELARSVRAADIVGVTDAVGGFESVLVEFDPEATTHQGVTEGIGSIKTGRSRRAGKVLEMPVAFDGLDLEAVGADSGLGVDGVTAALLGARLEVAVLGFAPGFAYLSGLPKPLLRIPRRSTPRPSVPAGSLAIAGGHAAVYPRSMPGGWQLVGRTDLVLFDPDVPPHALLQPGDSVRLSQVDSSDLKVPAPADGGSEPAGAAGDLVFVVESPGLLTTLQDGGRPGFAHLGVPRAGAADPIGLELANRLVGNRPGAACLELTAIGPVLECRRATHIAVVGPGTVATLDGTPVGTGRVVPVEPGQRLGVGATGSRLRSYLAVRGGFAGEVVFGSRSSDRLGRLGPGPLRAGDRLGAEGPIGPMADHLRPPERATTNTARVVLVGEGDWQRTLFDRVFEVQGTSDLVGVRLRPSDGVPMRPPEAVRQSAGTTLGTIQVPPDGNPVVLMPDHATLGGYAVAGVVITADRPELAGWRPGDTVRFEPVDQAAASAALRSLRRSIDDAVAGHYPAAAG